MSVLSKSALAGLGVSLMMAFPQSVSAQDETPKISPPHQSLACNYLDVIKENLRSKFYEARRYTALMSNGSKLDVYSSEKTGSWTHIVTEDGQEKSCVRGNGRSYATFPSERNSDVVEIVASSDKPDLAVCGESLGYFRSMQKQLNEQGQKIIDGGAMSLVVFTYNFAADNGDWTLLRVNTFNGSACVVTEGTDLEINDNYKLESLLTGPAINS